MAYESLEYGSVGRRTSSPSIARILQRLARPLGRCVICRTREADWLVGEFRSEEPAAECSRCAATADVRRARRAIDAFEAQCIEDDLRHLEAMLPRREG